MPAAVLVVATGLVPARAALGRDHLAAADRGASWRPSWCWRTWPTPRGCSATRVASRARFSGGRPVRLLGTVFAVAAVVTAVLSLDATVVLLTPVVFATAAQACASPRPHVYACSHLANSASLLLPVSNLTNLLAFDASGLSFDALRRADGAAAGSPWCRGVGWCFRALLRRRPGDARRGPPRGSRSGAAARARRPRAHAGRLRASPDARRCSPRWAAAAGARRCSAVPGVRRSPRAAGAAPARGRARPSSSSSSASRSSSWPLRAARARRRGRRAAPARRGPARAARRRRAWRPCSPTSSTTCRRR